MPNQDSSLPPLDFSEDIEKYDAKEERIELQHKRCTHENAVVEDGVLTCSCGAEWGGPQLNKLLKFFQERNSV